MYDWNALLEKCCNVKLNYNEKVKLFYMDIDIHENRYIKADDIYFRCCRRCWNKVWHFKL